MDKKSISIREREYILDCFLILIVLQIARIIIKNVLLSVLSFTAINLNIANIISIMIVGISVFLFLRGSSLFNPAGYRLTQMANKYENKKIRIILFSIMLVGLALTILLKTDYVFTEILMMCLATIAIPVYEELLFRKYLWNYVNSFVENQKTTWVVITIMSVLFILGYWDIVNQNLQIVGSDKFAVDVIFTNMKLGVLMSAITGFMKYKYKDIYLCIFLHIIISCVLL